MNFNNIMILMTLLAVVAPRAVEDDEGHSQTIGWGRNVAQIEEMIAEHNRILGEETVVLQMVEEEQGFGLGDVTKLELEVY